jgi:hypothetical protein
MDGGEGFDIGCDFGVVSLRAQVITFGMKVSRTEMNLDEVDRRLCCKRLTGKLVRGGRFAAPNQALLPGMEGEAHSVEGAFDVKRYGVNANGYTFSLSFSAGSVDANECQKLANSAGRLIVSHVEDLPDEDDGEDDEGHDDHEDVGPITKPIKFPAAAASPSCLADLKRDDGAAMPLSTLKQFGTTKGITKSLKAAVGGGTVGHLEKFMANNPEFWHRDIKGIGKEKLTTLQDAHLAFRQQHPMVSDEDRSDVDYAFHQGRETWDAKTADDTVVVANPYPAGDRRAKAWQLGWEAGEADSNAGTVFDQTGDGAAS